MSAEFSPAPCQTCGVGKKDVAIVALREATTRKIYLDERYRMERSHREFLEKLSRD